MKIQIKNCKNIDIAEIEIIENKLNIKYAMNGTGKSTIAKSIQAFVEGTVDASDLTPFKHRDKVVPDGLKSKVTGHEQIRSVTLFNEEYMNQFTFKPDEVLNNSFEIFVKTPDYDTRMAQIEELTKEIREAFKTSEAISKIVSDFGVFIDSFGKSKSGYSAAGALAKGIGNGNKIEHIPEGLDSYSDYLRSDKKLPWLAWQIKGTEYLGLSGNCPFCTLEFEAKKTTIEKVKSEYDAKSIEHLNTVLTSISKVEKYFSADTKTRVYELSRRASSLTKEEFAYLVQVKDQIALLREKLADLRGISYFSLKDVAKVIDFISGLKINLDFIPHLKSPETEAIVDSTNQTLDSVISKAGTLQGEVNKQKQSIERTVRDYSVEINEFLSNAGYKYSVVFELETDKYKLRLKHAEYEKNLSKGDQFLSFGERNAFALVLFMYESISKSVELIVLDDPISSFDRNKKFALIDMLFMKKRSLKNKTVLMLTHDFEPIIDMMHSLYKKFKNSISASFISETNGVLTELIISKSDIKSFTDVCLENMARHDEEIVKLIHLRRYYEIISDKGLPYELLSNLFHKRETPYQFINDVKVDLSSAEIEEASIDIRTYVPAFSYKCILKKINDESHLKSLYAKASSNYEKLQLFRVVTGEAIGDNILKKYINETFHIENDYVMQLNPCTYQTTPNYIVAKCDEEMLVLPK
jgi:energy-coupling factor transporter ATP-binding protein EcfA2